MRRITYRGRATRTARNLALSAKWNLGPSEWTYDTVKGRCNYHIGYWGGSQFRCNAQFVALTPEYPTTDREYCPRHLSGEAIGRTPTYTCDYVAPGEGWLIGDQAIESMLYPPTL